MTAGEDTVPTYCLLDYGATCSAISDDLAMKIKVKTKTLCIKLETFDQSSTSERDVASFTVMNLNQDFSINVKNALVGTIFSGPDELPPKKDVVNRYPHLRDIRFNELDDPSVGLILDAKFAQTFMTGDIRTGKENEPMAFLSRYGWVLVGPSVRSC